MPRLYVSATVREYMMATTYTRYTGADVADDTPPTTHWQCHYAWRDGLMNIQFVLIVQLLKDELHGFSCNLSLLPPAPPHRMTLSASRPSTVRVYNIIWCTTELAWLWLLHARTRIIILYSDDTYKSIHQTRRQRFDVCFWPCLRYSKIKVWVSSIETRFCQIW